MESFATIFASIKADAANESYTSSGIEPIYTISREAEIVIVGQAPGQKAQDAGIGWHDQSGKRLREWLGVSETEFYQSGKFAILPMDFYFPGKGRSGDLPPRKDFAPKWHPKLLALMPNVKLIILVGAYAQRYYLNLPSKVNLTTTVANYQKYLPKYLPIVHPSPLNVRWLKQNPWFERDVVPIIQTTVHDIIDN